MPSLGIVSNEVYENEVIEKKTCIKKYDNLKEASNEFEKIYIMTILKENNNNRIVTARELQISERSLYYKISKYGLG